MFEAFALFLNISTNKFVNELSVNKTKIELNFFLAALRFQLLNYRLFENLEISRFNEKTSLLKRKRGKIFKVSSSNLS